MQDGFHMVQQAHDTQLQDLKRKTEALADDNSVLRRLYFEDMYKRADAITDATDGTFDWLLTDDEEGSRPSTPLQTSNGDGNYKPKTIKRRQEEEERQRRQQNAAKICDFVQHGGGVFFFRGKPGSGKSTLMKYLVQGRGRRKLDGMLREWAGEKRLLHVSTMFLLHGTPLQRSLEGFYRTFFFELLCQCPDITDMLFSKPSNQQFPDDSFRSSFRLETLQEAWERLMSIQHHAALRIFVSIDGLDELEGSSGDRLKFARSLNDWAKSEDIKIISSGRPHAEFNIVFDRPDRRIDLQDLTRADIRKILMDTFDNIRHLSDLAQENIEELVDSISDQSEGVILWAVLVGKNLEEDIIHGNSLTSMKRTIQLLPPGIQDLFNKMWQDLRQDTHQQLMLRTIYELLVLFDGQFVTLALPLFWLEDAITDEEFPYNQTIEVLPATELNSRLDKVRGQLVQYTKHFVEVTTGTSDHDKCYLDGLCRFIHRSAQEFLQSKLGLVGSVPERRNRTFDLELRLNLIFQMSVEPDYPTNYFQIFANRPFIYPKWWQSHRDDPVLQLQHRLMERLREILEFRRGFLNRDGTTVGAVEELWQKLDLYSLGGYHHSTRRRTFSIFHFAVRSHQIDYVTRRLKDMTRRVDLESLNLGLFISVASLRPSFKLFELLLHHGAVPDSLIEIYGPEEKRHPNLLPLWLLLCFAIALKVSPLHGTVPKDNLRIHLSDEFLILERFLYLGHGFNVKFLAGPSESDPESDEDHQFGLDLAQVVRYAEPDNMSRLLLLLEHSPTGYLSLAQSLTSWVLNPRFFFQTLPHGATTVRFRRVSDEYLSREGWAIRAAFDGEHEIRREGHYYLPG